MTVPTAADRLCEARKSHQDAMRFACEFWETSDLLTCLSTFANRVYAADVGVDSTVLEVGISLRRLVAEKCISRLGVQEEEGFRELDRALYHLHVTLHTAPGIVTWEVRAAALTVMQEIEIVRWRDSL